MAGSRNRGAKVEGDDRRSPPPRKVFGLTVRVINGIVVFAAALATILLYVSTRADSHAGTPGICSINGRFDVGYVNAVLAGSLPTSSGRRLSVGVWIGDEERWYFKKARTTGRTWTLSPWEVSQPGDRPTQPFTFQAFALARSARLPPVDAGRPHLPRGFTAIGRSETLTRAQLLEGRTYSC